MINLLPISEKRKVHKLYIDRVSVTALAFLVISVVIGIIFLLPSFFLIYGKERSVIERISIAREIISQSGEGSVDETMVSVNKKLSLLFPEKDIHFSLSPVLKKILIKKPPNLKIIGLFYKQESNDNVREEKIIVRGRSLGREELLSFVEALREESLFTDVDLPIADLVENEDIPFSITVTFFPRLLSVADETLL